MSPLVVRTLEVPDAATLHLLHEALLACFGWSSEHLHLFTIRTVGYSSCWIVGAVDTGDVTLASLGLRTGERFTWRYDFIAGWVIEIRVEAVNAAENGSVWCVGGRRAGPQEWCRGAGGFYGWEDAHSYLEFLDCVDEVRDGVDVYGRPVDVGDAVARLRVAARWMVRDRFDKADLNRRLSALEVRSCVSSSRSG